MCPEIPVIRENPFNDIEVITVIIFNFFNIDVVRKSRYQKIY